KLIVRLRKREELPADSKFRQKKYDAALSQSHMSDDEKELNAAGEFTGRYVSYTPLYRSAEAQEFFDAIDAVKDPMPSNKYIPRVKAAERVDVPPKIAKLLKNKTRRWMVDPEWLQKDENRQYDTEARIVDSGKAWGDDEDPEDRIERQKRVREEKKEI
ncbi:hypothetical protein B0H21DRAFT_659105, partial [Amylocystis lapponica]